MGAVTVGDSRPADSGGRSEKPSATQAKPGGENPYGALIDACHNSPVSYHQLPSRLREWRIDGRDDGP